MKIETPVTFSGKVLDKRNDLTGPANEEKRGYPKLPKDVHIQVGDQDGQ
ncbi:hypothetical protein [Bacillus sp. FJAT-27251]|nr:hypothetical protein [Bacillus sp. FJAT-27251]